jgi:hypothetical protein
MAFVVVSSRGSLLVTVSAEPAAFVAPRCLPALGWLSRNPHNRRTAAAPCALGLARRSVGESR